MQLKSPINQDRDGSCLEQKMFNTQQRFDPKASTMQMGFSHINSSTIGSYNNNSNL